MVAVRLGRKRGRRDARPHDRIVGRPRGHSQPARPLRWLTDKRRDHPAEHCGGRREPVRLDCGLTKDETATENKDAVRALFLTRLDEATTNSASASSNRQSERGRASAAIWGPWEQGMDARAPW